jgi:hypothetical protein
MSKIHISSVTDSFEKILQDDIHYLDTVLSGYNSRVVEDTKSLYFELSNKYHNLKIKKSKHKLYCYTIYNTFVKYNILEPQEKIVKIFGFSKKKVCDSLKEIEMFLRFENTKESTNENINFTDTIHKIHNNYTFVDALLMNERVSQILKEHKEVLQNNHKIQSVIAGIIFFAFVKEYSFFQIFKNKIYLRKYISNILNVTESTIKIINGKLEKLNQPGV